jgi:hypothetical protein
MIVLPLLAGCGGYDAVNGLSRAIHYNYKDKGVTLVFSNEMEFIPGADIFRDSTVHSSTIYYIHIEDSTGKLDRLPVHPDSQLVVEEDGRQYLVCRFINNNYSNQRPERGVADSSPKCIDVYIQNGKVKFMKAVYHISYF